MNRQPIQGATQPPTAKSKRWNVVQASGRVTFVEKWGAKGLLERFAFHFDDGDAQRLAALLNRLDKRTKTARKAAA